MKRLPIIFIMTLFASISQANFTIYSNNVSDCNSLAGQWSGTGTAYSWIIGTCVYQGSGVLSFVDDMGHLTVQFDAEKKSGGFLCNKNLNQTLPGVCTNGVVTLTTDYGNLTGNFTETSGEASGTLSVLPGIKADISLKFQR